MTPRTDTDDLAAETPPQDVGLLLPAVRSVPAAEPEDSFDFAATGDTTQAVSVVERIPPEIMSFSFAGTMGAGGHGFEDLAQQDGAAADADPLPVLMVIADQQDFYFNE